MGETGEALARTGEPPQSPGHRPAPTAPTVAPSDAARVVRPRATPIVLDFYPLEEARYTEIAPFFDHLRAGRFTTTRCRREGRLLWPPRTVCPECHGSELEWVDLPVRGHLYAFSAVLAGAPLGLDSEVPFAVGLVELEGADLRLFGRIVGVPWTELAIGDPVRVEPFELPDGRMFYRFRRQSTNDPPRLS